MSLVLSLIIPILRLALHARWRTPSQAV